MQLLSEIRRRIYETVKGLCLPPDELERLYREQRADQIPFEHILCCEKCLDAVNNILGLPRLEERGPFDALTRQSSTRRAEPHSKKGGDMDV